MRRSLQSNLKVLITAPILTFDPELLMSVHTASTIQVFGAVMYQWGKADKQVITYASQTLLQNENNYNYGTPELEM